MAEIFKTRTIRPSTRKKESTNYKIDTTKLSDSDTIIINIYHEKSEFHRVYKFKGLDIYPKKSIHFKVSELNKKIKIEWSNNLTPIN